MSGAPSIKGTKKFPNPPIMKGITIKKIIMNAWLVIILLKIWSFMIILPQEPSSNRMIILIDDPTIPDHMAKSRYRIPMSL